tara:strand:+ start:212 stop:535 length:324 start_codon:yes stop_codon:yes gene_type:complete
MKKLFFLLSFSILFQSCFSYKSIGYNNIEINKKQKLEVVKIDKTNINGQLVSKNETTMILETKVGLQTIVVEEIYDVKVRKFAFLKTLGFSIVSPYLLGLLLYALVW